MMLKQAKRKGTIYERKIVNEARAKGHIAFRSAGSMSPFDVVIVNFKDKIIQLVQCKAGDSYSETTKRNLEAKHRYLNGTYILSAIVV